jgi:DnaJ-class molecular chaperone
MAKLKVNNLRKKICDNCHGNGYVRIAVGNTSIALNNSQVHQCWVCDSEGEVYEERTDLIDDNPFSNKLH